MSRSGPAALLFATMLPQTIMSMVVLTPPIVAGEVTQAIGLPVEAVGFYATLNYLFIAVGTLCSGALIPRIGPLRLSFICIFLGGIALAFFGIATMATVLLAVAWMGMCYGPLTPSSTQAIASRGLVRNLALFMSIRQTAVPLGGLLAGVIVPPLVVRFQVPVAMLVLGAAVTLVSFTAGMSLRLVRREARFPKPAQRTGLLAPIVLMLRDPNLLRLSLGSMIYGALQLVVGSLLVVFLTASLGRDLIVAGLLLSVSQAGAVIGRVGWGFVADRLGALRGVLIGIGAGMALMCFLAGLLTPATPNWLVGLVAFGLGATTSGWNGVFLTCLIRAVPVEKAGFAASGSLLFSYSGIMIGPPLFGVMAFFSSFSVAFFASAVLALVGAYLCRPVARAARPFAP